MKKTFNLFLVLSFLLAIGLPCEATTSNSSEITFATDQKSNNESVKTTKSSKTRVSKESKTTSNAKANRGKTGKYEFKGGGSNNEINIEEIDDNEIHVGITASYEYKMSNGEMMANSGMADGVVMLKGDTAYFTPVDSEGCKITIVFVKTSLSADQYTNSCDFGLNVSATGKYKKISDKPEFMNDDDYEDDSEDGSDGEDYLIENISFKNKPAETVQKQIRVRFAKGKTSKTFKGKIRGYQTVDYILGASYTQTFSVELTSRSSGIYFVVFDTHGNKLGDINGQKDYSTELPYDGDYIIRVFMPRAQARRNETANYSIYFSIE